LSETRTTACFNIWKECKRLNWIKFKRSNYFSFDKRLDTIEGEFGSLTDRVSKLELLVNTSENNSLQTDSNGSGTGHTLDTTYTKPEIIDIKNTLTEFKRSFAKQKKELLDVNYNVKDTFSVFLTNASSTVNTLVNIVSDYVHNSAENVSAALVKVNNTLVESGRLLRSDIITYLGNISSEVKIDMVIRFEKQKQEINKKSLDLTSKVLDHIANGTESLNIFKRNILQDAYETRANVQNETMKMEKKVDELIGKANEVVGIIDEQRSTIEDRIMVTIRTLHSSWNDWSAWSDCSQSCGRGSRSRHRNCDVTPPFTDDICIGNDKEIEECVIHGFCPYWSEWSPWSQCSQTCDTGTITRDRACIAPDLITSTCPGNRTESQTCLTSAECPSRLISQWVKRVYSSSPSSSDASQIVGEPDVSFETKVNVTSIEIYETYDGGYVTGIKCYQEGAYHSLYVGRENHQHVARIFSPSL
ncbi:AGRB2-like protein, partial [Mya arenaria]